MKAPPPRPTPIYPAYSGLKPYMDAIKDVIANSAVTYDPAKAEALFTAAGYAKNGDGVWAKDGQPLRPCDAD